jgi:6-phosphogluconolactonase
MTGVEVLVHSSADAVAEALAARLMSRLLEIQREPRIPEVALTGGRIATQAYQLMGQEGRSSAVDWSRVGLWWGDERFVPADDDDRNARQALTALSTLPLDLARVHPMPASGDGLDLDGAAEAYAQELGQTALDICLLGMGPDGHVASLFPDAPQVRMSGPTVLTVDDSPKPPPVRLTLSLPVINNSQRVWMILAGAEKASSLGLALAGAGADQVPVAGVKGRKRTVFFVDSDAASEVPENLIASTY